MQSITLPSSVFILLGRLSLISGAAAAVRGSKRPSGPMGQAGQCGQRWGAGADK